MLTGLSLPNHVPLRLSAMTNTHTFPFPHMFKEFLCSLPLPTHYRDYLVHSTRLVSTRNPTVSQLIQDDVRYDTVDEMKLAASQPCRCPELVKQLNIPLVQGHLFIRHPKLPRRVFGTDSRVLLQHGNNDELKKWRVIPQPFCLDTLPGHLWKAVIWPYLCDTIALWSVCVTNTYMLTWATKNILRTIQFEPWNGIYGRLDRLLLRLVHNTHRLPNHWGRAPRLLSPFCLIDWKTRLVFSHYRHPLCVRGRHISSCLQMLITEGARVVNTLEMPHCKDLLTNVRQWNMQLQAQWEHGELTKLVALFELDIQAMFPSLDRADVWNSISTIAELVTQAPGPRGRPRRGMLRFAVTR